MSKMKTVGLVMGSMLIGGLLFGSCESTDEQVQQQVVEQESQQQVQQQVVEQESQQQEELSMIAVTDDFTIEVRNVECVNKNMKINYSFTNNDTEPRTPWASIIFRAYQNGLQLDLGNQDNYNDDDSILPTYTNENLQEAFELKDDSVVVIYIEPWLSLNDEVFMVLEYNPMTNELVRTN